MGEDKGDCEHLALAALVQKNGVQNPPTSSEKGNALAQNKEITQQNEKVLSEASFKFHKEYVRKRLREAAPESVSTKQLFQEIQANGYAGAYNTVRTFVSIIRTSSAPETSLHFHKEYIRKRLEKAGSKSVSIKQIFEEIQANGYLGAFNTVKVFVSMIRINSAPEASLQFHKEYIKGRLAEAAPKFVSVRQLFGEMKAIGYLGSYNAVRAFVSTIRKKKNKGTKTSFRFHKEYIKKRLTEAISESISTKELFEEIKAKGYQGALSTVQTFISTTHTSSAPETSLQFHKEYIKKRLTETASESVSIRQLFEEIKASGYLGSYDMVKAFVSTIREKKNKGTEASFQFHKEYIKKRLEQAASESVSTNELFEEIKAKGYQGTLRTVQKFVSITHKSRPPEASLQFHKEYIKKRLRRAASEPVSPRQLFEEIIVRGYRGTLRTVQIFVSMIRQGVVSVAQRV